MKSRPRGRRPGAGDTREQILAAARARFAAHGYEGTSIRAVAADAAVDPALVHYFFETKDKLFVAALELPARPADVLAGLAGRDGLGERLLRAVLGLWEPPENRVALERTWGSALLPGPAADAARGFIRREIVARVAGVVGGPDAELRGAVVVSQMMGLLIARYIVRAEPLASMDVEGVVTLMAPVLQRLIDEPLSA